MQTVLSPPRSGNTAAKSTAKAKHPKAAKATAKPTLRQPRIEQRENWYTPTLADWDFQYGREGRTSRRSFILCEEDRVPSRGLEIARIEIPEHFSNEDANKIMCLIRYAPKLWRMLREIAPAGLNDGEDMRLFNEAAECLSQAAQRYPYEWPHEDQSEEALMVLGNRCRGRWTTTRPVQPVLPEEV